MRKFILTGITALALLATGCGTDDSVEQAAEQSVERFEQMGMEDMKNDALFAAEAASASMLQVKLSQAALDKAVSPEVKEMAQQLLQEHEQMLNDLQQMASQHNFVLPSTLGAAHQEVYNEVTANEGIAFDLAYVRRLANQYNNLTDRYEDMAENGKTMALQQYASKQLPLLRQQHQMIDELETTIDNV